MKKQTVNINGQTKLVAMISDVTKVYEASKSSFYKFRDPKCFDADYLKKQNDKSKGK